MGNTIFFRIIFLVIISCPCWATPTWVSVFQTPQTLSAHQDTIILTLGNQLEKFVQHTLQPKQTLFSLARYYGMKTNDLIDYNMTLGEDISKVGTVLRIPIPNKAIIRYQPSNLAAQKYKPIMYQVREGETLYRIARKYFRMPVDSLRFRNNIEGYAIEQGQLLHIGWMPQMGIPDSIQIYNNTNFKTNFLLEEAFNNNDASDTQLKTESGVAFWQKNVGFKGLFALHNNAPINAKIAVTNPMSNRTIFVKVIGRLPKTADREVVILSEEAAQYIGAKDARFFVTVRYKP